MHIESWKLDRFPVFGYTTVINTLTSQQPPYGVKRTRVAKGWAKNASRDKGPQQTRCSINSGDRLKGEYESTDVMC